MTVAIAVKVYDGIVLASDSATTVKLQDGSSQVYNNANKVFHLHRRKPIGAVTWGMGSIGAASISTLAKDLRRRLMGKDPQHLDWELSDHYTVQEVAERLVQMMFDELYAGQSSVSTLGFLVAGYSGHENQAEAWLVTLENTNVRPTPILAAGKDQSGWLAFAQPMATHRLFTGRDGELEEQLKAAIPAQHHQALDAVLTSAVRQPVLAGMPFADAISLGRFLVDVTIGYSRFLLGPDTVGGPVEVAGISRHEGFRWISRKHYYPPALNPEDPRHDF